MTRGTATFEKVGELPIGTLKFLREEVMLRAINSGNRSDAAREMYRAVDDLLLAEIQVFPDRRATKRELALPMLRQLTDVQLQWELGFLSNLKNHKIVIAREGAGDFLTDLQAAIRAEKWGREDDGKLDQDIAAGGGGRDDDWTSDIVVEGAAAADAFVRELGEAVEAERAAVDAVKPEPAAAGAGRRKGGGRKIRDGATENPRATATQESAAAGATGAEPSTAEEQSGNDAGVS